MTEFSGFARCAQQPAILSTVIRSLTPSPPPYHATCYTHHTHSDTSVHGSLLARDHQQHVRRRRFIATEFSTSVLSNSEQADVTTASSKRSRSHEYVKQSGEAEPGQFAMHTAEFAMLCCDFSFLIAIVICSSSSLIVKQQTTCSLLIHSRMRYVRASAWVASVYARTRARINTLGK